MQHLEHSYGFRCGMEPDEGIKLFDVCREGVVQTVMGLEWEIWDSRKHSAARVAVECSTTDVLSEVEVAWLMEKLEEQESRQHVREQQEVEVAGLRAEEEKRDDGALEDLEVSRDKERECMRRAQ